MKIAHPSVCTGCMACVAICSHNALDIVVDSNGYYQVRRINENCLECGLCGRICPLINTIKCDKNALLLSSPYAVWCKSEYLRSKSASGGAFAALAEACLKIGGVVYGSAIDGFNVKHIRVDSLSDLAAILGSKYQHSDMRNTYQLIKEDLKNGRKVLFGGLSCQVAGVLRYVGDKLSENLYTIDMICGGVSTMIPMLMLKESGKYQGIVSFRDKDNGWKSRGFSYSLKMMKNDDSIDDLGTDNDVIECFNNKLLKRSSCLDCQFNGFHRISDCTIGDFWGDNRFPEEHFKGVSVMVIHNSRIEQLVREANLKKHPVTWKEMVTNNPCYYWSHYPYLRKSMTRKLLLNRLKTANSTSFGKLTSVISKIETYFFFKNNHNNQQAFIDKLLREK